MIFYVARKPLSVAGEADLENESENESEIGPEIPEETGTGTGIGVETGRGRERERGYVIGTETEGKEEDTEDNALENCSHLKKANACILCVRLQVVNFYFPRSTYFVV